MRVICRRSNLGIIVPQLRPLAPALELFCRRYNKNKVLLTWHIFLLHTLRHIYIYGVWVTICSCPASPQVPESYEIAPPTGHRLPSYLDFRISFPHPQALCSIYAAYETAHVGCLEAHEARVPLAQVSYPSPITAQ